ncbi:DUF6506 family protein [Streptomyces sp. NPDC005963]|uniref:DUF6506 family protein n=1 Tax=Streptomyces sp. NPDC005963 TaxID=3156721 RepID=UPI0033E0E99F
MAGDRAIIHVAAGAGGAVRIGDEKSGTHIVAASSVEAAVALAVELVDRGVEDIDLCGATGYTWTAAVEAAVAGRARVSTVLFGFESLTSVADYKERATAGAALTALFVFVQEGVGPAREHFVHHEGDSRSVFVAVSHPDLGAAVAADFADRVQLIELYGGFTAPDVAAVIAAVDGRIPVGVAARS